MFSLLSLLKYLLIIGAPLVQASYTIDDTNSTIQYIPNGVGAGLQWHTSLSPEVNLTASYNQTTTVGECNSSQNCHLRIPFIGSGITIYVVQVNFAAINVSVTVDSLLPAIRTFPEPQWYLHNFSLFDIQELPSGSHTVDVALLDSQYNANDKYVYTNGTSALAFDFAIINDQLISSSSTPVTSPPSSSSSGSSGGAKPTPIGAIVGGAAGGLAAVAAIVIYLLCFRRRESSARPLSLIRRKTEIDPEPKVLPVAPFARSTTYTPVNGPSRTTLPPSAFTAENLYGSSSPPSTERGAYTALAPTNDDGPTSHRPGPPMVVQNPSVQSGSVSTSVAGRSSLASPPLSKKAKAPSLPPGVANQLTPEQLDFVHNLYSLNIPAADIAGVMERMRVEREVPAVNVTVDASMSLQSDDAKSEAPPRYEPR